MRLRLLARLEAELLFREYKNYPGVFVFNLLLLSLYLLFSLGFPCMSVRRSFRTPHDYLIKCPILSYRILSIWPYLIHLTVSYRILSIWPYLTVSYLFDRILPYLIHLTVSYRILFVWPYLIHLTVSYRILSIWPYLTVSYLFDRILPYLIHLTVSYRILIIWPYLIHLIVSYRILSIWPYLIHLIVCYRILIIWPYLTVGALPHFSERISFAIGKVTDAVTDALAGTHMSTRKYSLWSVFLPFLAVFHLKVLLLIFLSSTSSLHCIDVQPGDPLFQELLPLIRENLPEKLAEVAWDRVESQFPVQYQVKAEHRVDELSEERGGDVKWRKEGRKEESWKY